MTPRVGVRFPDEVTAAVDAAARAQDDEPNRSEMIRRIVKRGGEWGRRIGERNGGAR